MLVLNGDHWVDRGAKPEPGAQPYRFLQLAGTAKPSLTSGGKAESQLASGWVQVNYDTTQEIQLVSLSALKV